MGGTPKTALPPQDRAASLNKNLPHLPIFPSWEQGCFLRRTK
ncbi:hypothetical protein [Moorena sp. SIO4G3]|nr:hypothetical protein [Moorena sp. SIO4G3]